ncbi:MAG: FtsX-like permease family protein, partial [Bacteroidota bacterium]
SIAYSIRKRQKEIGIRKIIGATSSQIIQLLLKNYVVLILLGLTIGSTIGYFSSERFLEEYAFRVSITPSLFIISGLIIIGSAAILMIWQTLKVAKANPTHSLRSE